MTLVVWLVLQASGPPAIDVAALENRMVELVNIERTARGISPLEAVPELGDVARRYSERMAEAGAVHHELDRPMDERILDVLPNTCMFGENVSKNTSIDYALSDLMASEGHRANLLNDRYVSVGIGIVAADDGALYITQEFARPCEPGRRR